MNLLPRSKWLIYALGGGYGHFTRALSLARTVVKTGQPVEVLYNSELAIGLTKHYFSPPPNLHLSAIHPDKDRSAVSALIKTRLRQHSDYSVLIVDTFLRGLAGELAGLLPELSVPKILIHRDLNPEYLSRFDPQDALQNYQLIITPGESANFSAVPKCHHTSPWFLCDPNEVLLPDQAREVLGLPPTNECPCVAVMASGNQKEISDSFKLAIELQSKFPRLRVINLNLHDKTPSAPLVRSLWPAMRVMPAFDLLVCSGGYNTVHEARATQTRFLALAQPRLYDRQARRLEEHEQIKSVEEIFTACAHLEARRPKLRQQTLYEFTNGAHEAAKRISQFLSLEREDRAHKN